MTARIKMTNSKNIRIAYVQDQPAAFIVKTDRGYKVMKMNKKTTEMYTSYSEAAESAKQAMPVAV